MAVTVIDATQEIQRFMAEHAEDIPGSPAPAPSEKEPAKPASNEEEKPEVNDPDDIEGDDGLTARQKRELSSKMLKAIGKKHREMKEAEEFAAAQYSEKRLAEQRAAALEAEIERLKSAQPVPRETADPEAGKPKRDDFQTDQAYWDAYVDWRAEGKAKALMKEEKAREAKEAGERRQAEILETAGARIRRALEIVPDFEEVTNSLIGKDVDWVPDVVAGYMQKSEMFAELGYHLAKNPEILRSLVKMAPDEQLVTIGKIEATLKPFEPQGSKTTNGATPSKAANGHDSDETEPSETGSIPSRARGTAPVITPLSNTSALQVEKSADKMNTREMISAWTKEHRVNLNLRKRH